MFLAQWVFFGNTVKSSISDPTPVSDDSQGYYPSEARFLRRATVENKFFDNAVNHLSNQVRELKPSFIGIQEYYDKTLEQIQGVIRAANPNADYEFVPFQMDIFNKARTLTIFDKNVFGPKTKLYEADLGLTKRSNDENIFVISLTPGDKGRPITIIKTEKGFFLMNFHGPNRPRLNLQGQPTNVEVSILLKEALQIHITEAEKTLGPIDTTKLIITCDSNDRAHGINTENPLKLNNTNFHDGHEKEDGAKSCCYNLDSCGIDTPSTEIKTMGEDGAESKYIYTGDYVLATNFEIPVTAIDSPQNIDGASEASDHKLVYAKITITDQLSGGSRKRKSTKSSKKTQKRKHTKRQNKRKPRHHSKRH